MEPLFNPQTSALVVDAWWALSKAYAFLLLLLPSDLRLRLEVTEVQCLLDISEPFYYKIKIKD